MAGPFVKLPRDLSLVGLIDRLNLQFQRQFAQATTPSTVDPTVGEILTSPLWFDPDNTFDIGLYVDGTGADDLRPKSIYAGTKMRAPLFQADSQVTGPLVTATTRVTTPLLGTTTNTDVVVDRNSVTQLTLGSSLATFAGSAAFGAGAAQSGVLRMPYGDSLKVRDLAGTGDLQAFGIATASAPAPDPSNNMYFGGVGGGNVHFLTADGTKWLIRSASPHHLLPWHEFNGAGGNSNKQDIGATDQRLRGLFVGTHLTVGVTNSASTGGLRFSNNQVVNWRNAANTQDVGGMLVDTANRVNIGGNAAGIVVGASVTPFTTTLDLGNTGTSRFRRGYFIDVSMGGLDYTWPTSQTANRVLRNTGPGTLAWSQVDLSTDVTGALAGGTVPASRVTTGTFGTGDYEFPADITVTTTGFFGDTEANYANLFSSGDSLWAKTRLRVVRVDNGGNVRMGRVNGSMTASTPILNGQAIGVASFEGWTGAGGMLVSASFQANATEDWGASARGSSFSMAVTPQGTTTNTTAMLIGGSAGNAAVSIARTLRVGSTSDANLDIGLWLSALPNATGVTAYGVRSDPTFPATTTTVGYAGYFRLLTAASSFTMANGYGLYVEAASIGAGSTVTTGHGIRVAAQVFNGTTGYGLRIGNISGATTNYAIDTGTGLVRLGDDLIFTTDNTDDIGASGATRPRTGYFGTSLVTPLLTASTRVTAPLLGTTSAVDVVIDRNSVTQLTLGSLAATFAGTVATGAPTGGSGAWKLGVANAVSPTAPNRTITIDIGGTLYYLHAKTTND